MLDQLEKMSSVRLDFLIDVANKTFNQSESSKCLIVRIYSDTLVVKMTEYLKRSGDNIQQLDQNCRAILENLNFGNKEKPVNSLPFFDRTQRAVPQSHPKRKFTMNTIIPNQSYSGDLTAVNIFKANATNMFQYLMDLKDLSRDDMRMVMKLFMSL